MVDKMIFEDEDDNAHYLMAKCRTPHTDGNICAPEWDGFVYVCLDRIEREAAQYKAWLQGKAEKIPKPRKSVEDLLIEDGFLAPIAFVPTPRTPADDLPLDEEQWVDLR
jgi:hypothetical protein